MDLPLFQAPLAQSYNVLVVWVPDVKTERLQVDVGQSVQWCYPSADCAPAVGDTVRVTRIGQTLAIVGIVAKAPTAETTTTTTDASSSSSTGAST